MNIMNENEIGTIIVDEAVRIHKALGPGLLEIVYEAVLARRLEKRGLVVERQKPVSIEFEGEHFEYNSIYNEGQIKRNTSSFKQ